MKNRPFVSVLMSVYNSAEFLEEAVQSILNQTYSNFEFLIYDDCSTDESVSILKKFSIADDRVRLVLNESNRGLTYNLQQGMINSKGTYVARMDSDDIALPERLEKQVEFMESHPEISVLGTSYVPFIGQKTENEVKQPVGHEAIKCELLLQFTLVHPTVMIRRNDLLRKNINYDPVFRYSQDFDLWQRVCEQLKVENMNTPLLYLRGDHPGKISTRKKRPQQECSNRVRERQLNKLGVELSPTELAVFNDFGSLLLDRSINSIRILDQVLDRIITANEHAHIYDAQVLKQRAAELFYWQCLAAFSNDIEAGRYYLKSQMRRYAKLTLKQTVNYYMFFWGIRR